jgi:2-desacetyl-2-hydroxyethyl bacteriochlorophyllide A dehydrogenase
MRAVRLVEQGKPLVEVELELPEVGPHDLLVRVRAAGICHSDAHYRDGTVTLKSLPLTPGHEVAGVVEKAGESVRGFRVGDRVCLHYMATCGCCSHCNRGSEQFCDTGTMIGNNRDGGYAEYIVMPERSAFLLPDQIPFDHGAIMMCSSATSLHALRKARLVSGETVAVFGAGGLGTSAIQLARCLGAMEVYAVDIRGSKLAAAESYGAIPVDASKTDPVEELRRLTGGRGVDVALELVGTPQTMEQSFRCLAVQGRAAVAGLGNDPFQVRPYHDLLGREAEIIGVSDHLASEIPQLLDWAGRGGLDLSRAVTRSVPLEAGAINSVLDDLMKYGSDVRVVITP